MKRVLFVFACALPRLACAEGDRRFDSLPWHRKDVPSPAEADSDNTWRPPGRRRAASGEATKLSGAESHRASVFLVVLLYIFLLSCWY